MFFLLPDARGCLLPEERKSQPLTNNNCQNKDTLRVVRVTINQSSNNTTDSSYLRCSTTKALMATLRTTYRKELAKLPVKHGGLALPDLTKTAKTNLEASDLQSEPPDLPPLCVGCNAEFSVKHALSCMKGGLMILSHSTQWNSGWATSRFCRESFLRFCHSQWINNPPMLRQWRKEVQPKRKRTSCQEEFVQTETRGRQGRSID